MKYTDLAILTLLYILITHTFFKEKFLQSQSIPSDIKKLYEFCTIFCGRKLIVVPTCVTRSSSTIIHHILGRFPDRISQQSVIDVGMFDQ